VERLQDRFRAAHTQVLGISVDSKFCHAGWAGSLGGISFPLLADFQPKGATAKEYGLYLEEPGITDRATVIIDAAGNVKHASSVGPGGERDIEELLKLCEEVDKGYDGDLPAFEAGGSLESGATLYVKSSCGFSAWALEARKNLHLEAALPIKNVSEDSAAMSELESGGGKGQAPCLKVGDKYMYEAAQIIGYLCEKTSSL
jgi:glutaredoxin